MTRPSFNTLIRLIGASFIMLTMSYCNHLDYGLKGSGDDNLDSESNSTDSDPAEFEGMEKVVEYGAREPIVKAACEDSSYKYPLTPGYTPDPAIEEEVQAIMETMSLADKAHEMRGTDPAGGSNKGDIFRQPDNDEKGIRGFQFRDGPRGLNLAAELQPGRNGYSTAFPVSMARGATFDLSLEKSIGEAQGEETLASRNTLMLAPTVNLLRHPAWGRAQETYGEDPFLLGRMGTAYTVGVQTFIPACVKHYMGNNVENGRTSLNHTMDEQTLREIYGRAFEMIVRDGGVACVMAAYNKVNGEKCTENAHILTNVLRDDFGFKGFVLSDWWAMSNGNISDKLSGEYQAIATAGVSAGMDMELPWNLNYSYIEAMVEENQIKEGKMDDKVGVNPSVARILAQKFRFNVGDQNSPDIGLGDLSVGWDINTSSIKDNDAHIALAEKAATEAAVLLKNDDQTLPIPGTVSKVAVLSATVDFTLDAIATSGQVNYAKDVITGDLGSSRVLADPALSVSPLAGIEEAAGSDITVVSGSSADDAADADYIIVVAGMNAADEGEEYTGAGDRASFALDSKIDSTPQDDLIAAAADLGKPMVVVLIGGSVIDMPWLDDVPAVLMAWYPGMVGGRAIGKLLFGKAGPSGKLPITWPASYDDEPEFNPGNTIEMGYFAGYRYFEQQGTPPLFPFGHGLSYSQLEYLNLEVPCSTVTSNGVVEVKVDVSNRGDVAADEVAFLFVAYPDASDERKQIKQLKGFYRVSLKAGETKQITLPLRINDLRFYDMASESWKIESGTVDVMVGPSSVDDLLLTDQISISGT